MIGVILSIAALLLAYKLAKGLIEDTVAMIKAPKGRKIEAYYTSLRGTNPLTGKKGRDL